MTQEFEIVYGKAGDCTLVQRLATAINEITPEGTFYIDYPIFAFGEQQLRFDALYTSRRFGLTVFDLSHYDQSIETVEQKIRIHQEYLYSALVAKLLERPELRQDRGLVLYPQVLSIHSNFTGNSKNGTLVCTINDLQKYLKPVQDLSRHLYQCLNGFIQRTTSLHPSKNRISVKSDKTIGGKLNLVENEIVNLGYAQKKAAIEPYEGPQRLRGLAGTGKTTVLALKAALLHISHPEWRILVTFNSSPLYKQYERLIRQFIYEYNKEEPNWDKLTVRHSWGSLTSTGVYTEICSEMGRRPTKLSGKISSNGIDNTFNKVCNDLLVKKKTNLYLAFTMQF